MYKFELSNTKAFKGLRVKVGLTGNRDETLKKKKKPYKESGEKIYYNFSVNPHIYRNSCRWMPGERERKKKEKPSRCLR